VEEGKVQDPKKRLIISTSAVIITIQQTKLHHETR